MYYVVKILLAAFLMTHFLSCSSAEKGADNNNPSRIELRALDSENRIGVFVEGELFTAYFYPQSIKKPVLFPILTPSGHRITRGFPFEQAAGERVDHPHHIGMWLNYGDVNGLDFWNNSDSVRSEDRHRYGQILHLETIGMESGDEEGRLSVSADWVGPDGAVLLEEKTLYQFRAEDGRRIVDRITTLTASDEEVLFRDNKEGMFALRVTRALEHPENSPAVFTDENGKATDVPVLDNEGVTGHYINSEGVEGGDCWGKRARWMTLRGKIGNELISITILDHPGNPGYPTYWHARGYGLFSANPLGQRVFSDGAEELNFTLPPGASTTFRYRVIIDEGAEHLSAGEIEREFSRFTQP